MSIFDDLFGSSSSTGSSTTQAYASAPAWYQQGLQSLVTRADAASQQPYPTYPGQRIAPFSAQEQQAFTEVGNQYNAYQPDLDQARSLIGQAGQPLDYSTYMNPYTQEVVDATMAEMDRQSAMGMNTMRASAANSGGLNSSREGVAEAEYMKAQDMNKAMMASGLYQQGFQKAQDMALADANRQLQVAGGMTSIAGAGQTMGLTGANALMQSGAQQRGLEQASADVAYQDFINQRDWEMNQLRNFASVLQGQDIGAVSNSSSTTTTTVPGPSALSNVAGLGTIGLSGALAYDQIWGLKDGGLVGLFGLKGLGKKSYNRKQENYELVEDSILSDILQSSGLMSLLNG